MTTTTPKPAAEALPVHPAREILRGAAGFTLGELLVATGLSGIILAAVLSSFLFIGRAGMGMNQYVEMETQARGAMETFAQDVRMASAIDWHSSSSLTLTIERSGSVTTATYTYHATKTDDAEARTFTRTFEGETTVLITDIKSFSFHAYSIDTAPVNLAVVGAASNLATKQVQISLEAERTRTSLADTTNKVVSARFVLRNKRVTA